jgi:predicted metal-dependent hydrolase
MDFKKMLLDMAEAQADKMKDEAVGFIGSEEFAKQVATKINEKIDIPFVSEDKEQIFFEKVVDVVTDLLEGVFKGK